MREIKFELESLCPIMMDKFVDGKQPSSEKEYEKMAIEKVYQDEKGNIAIPSNSIKASMRDASSHLGKKMESKIRRENIRAFVFIEPEFLSLGIKKPDLIDKRMVTRNSGTKNATRVPSYRPLIKKWKVKGTITLMDGLEAEHVKESLDRNIHTAASLDSFTATT